MPLSSKSRELVRLQHGKEMADIGRRCRCEIDRMKQTMPRGGGSQKAIDDRHVQFAAEGLHALTELYLRAYDDEGAELTIQDIDQIVGDMAQQTQGLFRNRMQLEPRSVGIGFREKLDEVVQRERHNLLIAMKRRERDRAIPRREPVGAKTVYNISGPNARVNINSTDSSVNVVNVATTQLFSQIREAITEKVDSDKKRDELLLCVDDLENTQGTGSYLTNYQRFVGALADHITLFQAFLPALLQLIS